MPIVRIYTTEKLNTDMNPNVTEMQKLMANKDVKFIRHKNAPRFCYIEFSRDKDGSVKKFTTHFEKKSVEELNDNRSILKTSTSPDWKVLTDEDVKNLLAEKSKVSAPTKSNLEVIKEEAEKKKEVVKDSAKAEVVKTEVKEEVKTEPKK